MIDSSRQLVTGISDGSKRSCVQGDHPHPSDLTTDSTQGRSLFGGSSMDFVILDSIPRSDWWPVVKMADGTLRKGPYAEIVGRWK